MEPFAFRELETDRLLIKPFEATFAQAEAFFRLITENRDFLTRYLFPLNDVRSAEDEFAFLEKAVAAWESHKDAQYGLWTREGVLIGSCSLIHIHWEAQKGEIGYMLAQNQTGKGYMAEAVHALENEFFARGLNRIQIVMDVENKASENVAIRCGYKFEGICRQSQFNTTLNAFRDLMFYSKLKSEWEKQS